MRDFNKVIILGNMTRDPEMRYTPNGKAVCSFSVATNRRWTGADGNAQESTEFHNIVTWGKLAETASQILTKGRQVLVEGRLQTRNWEGQDGVKRYKTEIIAENFSAVGANRPGSFEKDMTNASSKEPELDKVINDMPEEKKSEKNEKPISKPNKSEEDKIDLDDIPF
jgi:single-strand DNA-binding protein